MSDQTASHYDDDDAPQPTLLTRKNVVIGILLVGGTFAAWSYTHYQPPAGEKREAATSSEQTVAIGMAADPKPPAIAAKPAAPAAAAADPGPAGQPFDLLQASGMLDPVKSSEPAAPAPAAAPSKPTGAAALPQAVAFKQQPLPGVEAVSLPDPYTSIYPDTPIYLTCDRLDTDHPGPVSCSVVADVKAAEGGATLIPRGSSLHGRIVGQMQRGVSSMSVSAAYVITADEPRKYIPLADDPMLNDQGAAGLPANVDDRLWPRIKTGTIITLIDGAFGLGQSALSKVGSTNLNLNTGSAQNAADEAFQQDLNIPSHGTRDQGATAIVRTSQVITFPGYKLRALP